MTRSTAIHDRVAEAILDAAARLLVERGEPPRLADVAAAAGVARATLYRHFPTRERLLEALTAVALDATATGLAEAGLDAVPVPEGIARVARVVAAGGSKYAAMIDRHGPGYDGAVEQQIGTMIRALLQRGVDDGTFRSDLSVDELAYLFGQLLQAAAHMTAEQVAGVEKAAALVSTVFLHGTQNRTDPAPQPGALSEHPLPLLPEEVRRHRQYAGPATLPAAPARPHHGHLDHGAARRLSRQRSARGAGGGGQCPGRVCLGGHRHARRRRGHLDLTGPGARPAPEGPPDRGEPSL